MIVQVSDFFKAYPTLSFTAGSLRPLPNCGEFIRFVKRHNNTFTYESQGHIVRLVA